jgi:hypothetical protein
MDGAQARKASEGTACQPSANLSRAALLSAMTAISRGAYS